MCEDGAEEVVVEDSAEVRRAKALEVDAVKTAEEGRLQAAAQLLTDAITLAPHYPSPYNNRAQVSTVSLCGPIQHCPSP